MKEDEDEKAIQGENNYDEDNNNDKTEFISIRNFLISFLVLVALRMNISSLQDLWEFFLNLKKWNFLKLIWIFFGKLLKVLIYTSNKYIQ